MSMTKGTPASSQIVWLEGRVQELEAENERLGAQIDHLIDAIAQLQEIVNSDTAEEERIRAENERLKTSGIAEVAAHNPSVMDYMRHWEGRAGKAEAENERLRAALRKIIDLGGAYGSAEYARQADSIARAALEKETSA